MCFHCWQPLPVSRINRQILSREQSKQSLLKLPSSVSVHKNLAGILVQSCYLSPGGWVHVRTLACMYHVCVFTKSQGVMEQIVQGATRISPAPANKS